MKLIKYSGAHFYMGLLCVLTLMTSCVKESQIGSEILPSNDLMSQEGVDTITLSAHIMEIDSINTSNDTYYKFGALNDPDFGTTVAETFTQINLPGNNFSFSDTMDLVQLDSVVLMLKYYNTYGNSDFEHELQVYEIDEAFVDSVTYYTESTFNYSTLLGSANVVPNSEDSIMGPNGYEYGVMSITLDNDLGIRLLNVSGQEEMTSDETFTEFFKGICIKSNSLPSSNDGSVINLSLFDPGTKLVVYYSEVHADTTYSLSSEFPINSSAKTSNYINNDYLTNLEINNQVLDSAYQAELVYLEGMNGLKLRVKFPHIDSLVNKSYAVGNASLVLPVNRDSEVFLNPSEVYVKNISYNPSASLLDGQYVLNITTFLQQYIAGNNETKYIDVHIKNYETQVSRTVLNGPNHVDNPLKLFVTFTEY